MASFSYNKWNIFYYLMISSRFSSVLNIFCFLQIVFFFFSFLFDLISPFMLKCFQIWGAGGDDVFLFWGFFFFFSFWPGSSSVSYHIFVCSVKKLIGNLMCFNKACPVGLGYFGRASPNVTYYMYIFSVGLSSFPRNVFSSVLLGGQMRRTKQTSSVLEINQGMGPHA